MNSTMFCLDYERTSPSDWDTGGDEFGDFCEGLIGLDGEFELADQDILNFQRDCEERQQQRSSGVHKQLRTNESLEQAMFNTKNNDSGPHQPLPTTWDETWYSNAPPNLTYAAAKFQEVPSVVMAGSPMMNSSPSNPRSLTSSDSAGCTVPDQFLSSATSAGLQPLVGAKILFGVVPQAPPPSAPPSTLMSGSIPQVGILGLPDIFNAFSQAGCLYPPNILFQRQECLRRYREKKARRMYTKQVRYQLRKINADRRPRIKGRFIKKGELLQMESADLARASSDTELCAVNSEGEEDSSM